MATSRFILSNVAETATILNGTGGGAPARTEVAPYMMDRALTADRRQVWKAGAPTTTGPDQYLFDIDLGSAKAISAAAAHGLSCPGGVINAIGVIYYNTYPSAPTGVGGMALNGRDAGMVFPVQTKRYWTVVIEATAAPVVGRLVLGVLTDIGLGPNPGAVSSPYRNRIEQQNDDGSFEINELGYPGHDFELTFAPVTSGYRATLESLSAVAGTVTYFDPRDRCFEIVIKQGRVASSRDAEGIDSISLQMSRCP